MKIVLGDKDAKIGKEKLSRPTIGNFSKTPMRMDN